MQHQHDARRHYAKIVAITCSSSMCSDMHVQLQANAAAAASCKENCKHMQKQHCAKITTSKYSSSSIMQRELQAHAEATSCEDDCKQMHQHLCAKTVATKCSCSDCRNTHMQLQSSASVTNAALCRHSCNHMQQHLITTLCERSFQNAAARKYSTIQMQL